MAPCANIVLDGYEDVSVASSDDETTSWPPLEYNFSSSKVDFTASKKVVIKSCEIITSRTINSYDVPTVAVIGTGYVGYNLVSAFGAHYRVLAFDVSAKRIKDLSVEFKYHPLITCTANPRDLSKATHFLIAVPTTLLANNKIDTSCIESALDTIDRYARRGATVVIESSVAVGMTRQLLEPLMRSRGLKAGMSPERVDPGRTSPAFQDIPKLVSGLDDITTGSLASISNLYSKVFSSLVAVSSPEVAEMTKLYENCQRMVCIAYANEMADACTEFGISPFEVCSAASTKPFGYQSMTPSLGVGGHCIPVNPFYLFSSSVHGDTFPLLRSATETMIARPAAIGDRIMSSLFTSVEWRSNLSVGQQPRALVCGIGFKPGQSVLSNSPGHALLNHLGDVWKMNADFADPLVKQEQVPSFRKLDDAAEWEVESIRKYDVVIVAMRQSGLDFSVLDDLQKTTDVNTRVHWCCS
ncbi:polysaccharide biosynthesis protein vipA/tviB [Rhexocercosporidium sp. MPI-PUGE-AT-0058]|nr:polysaccharide biosynthesis protein vipA/tviB [Rhexocercosporidium sp. MPI-PUGE-AT-0058]